MATQFDTRRYLTDFDSNRSGNVLTDVLVIGSGVAGARAAIEAARFGQVILLCKAALGESATRYAQGGIAVAGRGADDLQLHYDDTLRVGCGLCDPQAVRILVSEGPQRIAELIEWGIQLDRTNGELDLAREGGHSVSRVVHARGDQTGLELARTLHGRVAQTPSLRVFEQCFFLDFLTVDGACLGAVTFHPHYGHQLIWAKRTILASGGCGQVWRETTNPSVSTGDGVAASFRAGARIRDMEFMQFHPTTLYVAGAARALISEAVRGEGAYLVDRAGRRFMCDHHPDAELAPRDIVSRAIHAHLQTTRSNCVYLDVRHIPVFTTRFPGIAKLCADFQIDVTSDLIPVRPSAHYMVGGVETAADGSTSVPGLLSCGEAACSGVHGANRMASNSLLEGLVFGKIAGETAGQSAIEVTRAQPLAGLANRNPPSARTSLDLPDIRNSLRSLMWRNVGIVRTAARLAETREILDFWGHYTLDKTFDDVLGWEVQNQLTVARLAAMSALERTESVGVHFRDDASATTAAPYHIRLTRTHEGTKALRH